jgi:hypothetical protein
MLRASPKEGLPEYLRISYEYPLRAQVQPMHGPLAPSRG